jgi:UDP-N-acetylmuramoyl-L-alanyl-D-glutamate--2,6-diaminopimelate ligase
MEKANEAGCPGRAGGLDGLRETGDANVTGFAASGDVNITGFAIDNRKVAPGNVFGAFPGLRVNGEDFIPAAVAAGAVAVVARPEAKVEGAIHIAADEPRRLSPNWPRASISRCPRRWWR